MLDFFRGGEFLFHFRNCIDEFQIGTEDETVRFFEVIFGFRADLATGNTDAVEPYDASRVSVRNDEGADVLHDFRHAADHGAFADLHKLMNPRHGADDRVVLDDAVTGDPGVAGDDDVISDAAIVRDMGIGLKHIVRTDARLAIFTRRTMNRTKFAELIAVANHDGAMLAFVFQILRVFPDDRAGIDVIVLSHAHIFRDDRIRTDNRALADFTMRADDREWTDDDIFVNDGGGIDAGCGMDFGIHVFDD